MGEIFPIPHTILARGLKEAWPSAVAGKLGIRTKQPVATYRTKVCSPNVDIPILSRESPLRALFAGNMIEVGRKDLFPNSVGYFQLGCIGIGIIRIVVTRRVGFECLREGRSGDNQQKKGKDRFHSAFGSIRQNNHQKRRVQSINGYSIFDLTQTAVDPVVCTITC